MKTIDEAAKEYASNLSSSEVFRSQHNKDFKAGAEFVQRWIPVEEELPDFDVDVIWRMDSGYCFISEIDHDCDWETFKKIWEEPVFGEFEPKDRVTHWRPIEYK